MPQVKKKSFIQKNGLVAVWSMAGFMAMGYIGFLATESGNHQSEGTQVAGNGDTPSLALVSPVRQEIAALRAHVAELTNREESTAKKLSIIEEALGPNTAALPNQQNGLGRKEIRPVVNSVTTPAKSSPNVSVNLLPLSQNDNINELLEADRSENYGIDLASARSIDSLKRHWNNLKKANSDLLHGLTPHFIDKGASDLPLYSLVIGPFDRMSEARGHCIKLSMANIECQETHFQMATKKKIHTADRRIPK